MQAENFTNTQLDALSYLVTVYPSGVGVDDAAARLVSQSIIDRGSGLVELIDSDETPTGDAYRLSDSGAEAFCEDAQEMASKVPLN